MTVWKTEQWEIFGMLAHMMTLDNAAAEFELCTLEADGECEREAFNAGAAEMGVWLRLYVKRGIARKYAPRVQYAMANPLTIH